MGSCLTRAGPRSSNYPEGKAGGYTIPDSVTSIGTNAFQECTSLTSITIGTNVTSIGNYEFYFCPNLISVIIPNSVTTIEEGAFSDCQNLSHIYFTGNAPSLGSGVFGGYSGYDPATVYYLAGTTGWTNTFGGLRTMLWQLSDGIVTTVANPWDGGAVSGGGPYSGGHRVQISATPSVGWTFTGWSDGGAQKHTIIVPSGGAIYTANFTNDSCTYTLSATNVTLAAKGGSKNVSVKAKGTTCSWTASTTNSWITITSGGTYTGNGKVDYTVPGQHQHQRP